jgi:hypothetical protein
MLSHIEIWCSSFRAQTGIRCGMTAIGDGPPEDDPLSLPDMSAGLTK